MHKSRETVAVVNPGKVIAKKNPDLLDEDRSNTSRVTYGGYKLNELGSLGGGYSSKMIPDYSKTRDQAVASNPCRERISGDDAGKILEAMEQGRGGCVPNHYIEF